MATQILYPATTEKVANLRSLLTSCGVTGARVRRMANGAARLVLASKADRDAARDALTLADARTCSGVSFASPDSRFAWNGPVEIFIRFGAQVMGTDEKIAAAGLVDGLKWLLVGQGETARQSVKKALRQMDMLGYRSADDQFEEWDFDQLVIDWRRYREALEKIGSGATGYLDRDSELAEMAREALAGPTWLPP